MGKKHLKRGHVKIIENFIENVSINFHKRHQSTPSNKIKIAYSKIKTIEKSRMVVWQAKRINI